jgi:hypothetical protein
MTIDECRRILAYSADAERAAENIARHLREGASEWPYFTIDELFDACVGAFVQNKLGDGFEVSQVSPGCIAARALATN